MDIMKIDLTNDNPQKNLGILELIDKRYFTPSIEDIRVGYEYETAHSGQWEKEVVNPHNIEFAVQNVLAYSNKDNQAIGFARVPYLTKEQIEAEGWDFGNSYLLIANYEKENSDEVIMIGRKKDYKLGYNFFTHSLKITKHSKDEEVLFNGIVEDINTFRYITKLLGIC